MKVFIHVGVVIRNRNMPPATVIMMVLRIHNHGSQKKIKSSFVVYNHGSEFFGKKNQIKSPSYFIINFMY